MAGGGVSRAAGGGGAIGCRRHPSRGGNLASGRGQRREMVGVAKSATRKGVVVHGRISGGLGYGEQGPVPSLGV